MLSVTTLATGKLMKTLGNFTKYPISNNCRLTLRKSTYVDEGTYDGVDGRRSLDFACSFVLKSRNYRRRLSQMLQKKSCCTYISFSHTKYIFNSHRPFKKFR